MNLQIPSITAAQVAEEPTARLVSRPFDVYRWIEHQPMASLAARIHDEIDAVDERKRQCSRTTRRRRLDAVRALVTDCIVAAREPARPAIGISLDSNAFKKQGRLNKLWLTARTFRWAFRGLLKLGYIKIVKSGFHDPRTRRGCNTKIIATEKLLPEADSVPALPWHRDVAPIDEAVIIRGPKPKSGAADILEPRPDQMARVLAMQAELDRLNFRLRQHWVDLELSDSGFRALALEMAGSRQDREFRERITLDLSRRTYRRIFNNGSLEEGGRLYGPWWQGVPKEFRCYITIDGVRTVELDFSGMHPRMLYAQANLPLPSDPYSPLAIGIPEVEGCRDMIKRTFNAMINARTKQIRKPANFEKLVPAGMTWAEFKNRIADFHAPIARHFYSGAGLRLQAVDADIAVQVMLTLADQGIPVLGVHDSFIVQDRHVRQLRVAMEREFRTVVGVDAVIKETAREVDLSEIANRFAGERNICPLLRWNGRESRQLIAHSQYDSRQTAWKEDPLAKEIRRTGRISPACEPVQNEDGDRAAA